MLVTTLPYPGIVIGGNRLRRLAAKSITSIEDAAGKNNAAASDAAKLAAFFQACADAANVLSKPKQ
jgi:hypothetical protein